MSTTDLVAVLVDAGYLFKAGGQALAGRPVRRDETTLDAGAAVEAMVREAALRAPHARLLRVYWYDGSRGGPTQDQLILAELDNLKLRLGTLNNAGEQKQVDPLIITDMMSLSQKGAVSDLVLVSGDADLIVGVTFAQEFGVRVHLRTVAPTRGNASQDLRHACDTVIEWVGADVAAFLRVAPPAVTPSAHAPLVAGPYQPENVVAEVVLTLTPQELHDLATGQPGLVPGSVNHRLLGIARARNGGASLAEEQKRDLRKKMYEAGMKRYAEEKPPLP